LQALREQVDQALADVPPALSLGENMNVQPVKLPLFVNAQLGFMAVYLLADYDDLARKLILAHHTALIDRSTLERWLNDGAHALRSLFSLAQQYRYSGATRDDFASKNAVARAALEKFGELPQDVLEGTRRSRFAPPIARRAGKPGTPLMPPTALAQLRLMADSRPVTAKATKVLAHDRIVFHKPTTRFLPLEQADFQRLEHAGYLKGLLQPFKGKGSLEAWASQCTALRDGLIGLAQRRVLQQARAYPFSAARRATCPADDWRRDDLPALAQSRPFFNGRGVVGIAAGQSRRRRPR
jgi:hypothetical protein